MPTLAAEKLLKLGTGDVTGVYYPAGGAICRLVNRGRAEHGIHCMVDSTGGSVNNLEAVHDGTLDCGIAQSDWLYHAYTGTDIFKEQGANTKLRVLFALHSEPFTVLVRKDSHITNFDQLQGKRINIGNPGSGMRATMEDLMRQKGWNDKSFAGVTELKATEEGKALCDGQIDAMIYAAGHPNGEVKQVTDECGAKLIAVSGPDVDAFIQRFPFYSAATIPANMYRGNPNALKTFGVKAVVFASSDMDPNVAYEIVKAVFDNLDNFKTLHPVFATLDARGMALGAPGIAPLHEGAAKYFKEKGLIK